jgi:hypothetical protein
MPRKRSRKCSGWKHAYRKIDGRIRPVLVRNVAGREQVKIVSDAYIRQHHPRGPWNS